MSCFSKKNENAEPPKRVTDMAQDIWMPKELMLEVIKELGEDTKTMTPVYMFVPLQVELNDKSKGVLSASPLRFTFPKGGGQLDLKDYVVGQGSFYLNFNAELFSKMPELVHLYYISQAPVKKIDDENYGLGCGKWVDIKNQFKNLQKENFLKINSTQLRYLYVLSGSYVFVFRENNQIYLSQLTITDSRHQNELCLTKAGDHP
jgi:hypothetical protein